MTRSKQARRARSSTIRANPRGQQLVRPHGSAGGIAHGATEWPSRTARYCGDREACARSAGFAYQRQRPRHDGRVAPQPRPRLKLCLENFDDDGLSAVSMAKVARHAATVANQSAPCKEARVRPPRPAHACSMRVSVWQPALKIGPHLPVGCATDCTVASATVYAMTNSAAYRTTSPTASREDSAGNSIKASLAASDTRPRQNRDITTTRAAPYSTPSHGSLLVPEPPP